MPTGPKSQKRLAGVIGNAVKVMRFATDVLQRFDYRLYGKTPSTFSED